MSFDADLEAARALASEYASLLRTIQGMAAAEDHDPRWRPSDTAKLDELQRQYEELGRQLTAALAQLERDHHDAWRTFLSTSVERLQPLASYETERWTSWLQGEVPDDPATIFARGVRLLDA